MFGFKSMALFCQPEAELIGGKFILLPKCTFAQDVGFAQTVLESCAGVYTFGTCCAGTCIHCTLLYLQVIVLLQF